MTLVPDFYLVSSDSPQVFETPIKCVGVKRLRYEKRDDFLLVEINPSVRAEKFNQEPGAINNLVLAARHQGRSLFPIKEWPVFVFVCIVQNVDIQHVAALKGKELLLMAWGEIYQTEKEAMKASEEYTLSNLHNPKL